MGKIFIASKPVALGKEHLYLVYDPNEAVNGDEEVIRGGPFKPMEAPNLVDPDHGNIYLDAGRLLTKSDDKLRDGETRTSQNFTEVSIPVGETAETLWGKLVNFTKTMGTYDPTDKRVETPLDYAIGGPNSNSTIGVFCLRVLA